MTYTSQIYKNINIQVELAEFASLEKVNERHIMLHSDNVFIDFQQQLQNMSIGIKRLFSESLFIDSTPVFVRCFLSDATNQFESAQFALSSIFSCHVSYVQQPPLDGTKIAIWIQTQSNLSTTEINKNIFHHNGYTHFYTTSTVEVCLPRKTSYLQTHHLLEKYEHELENECFSIESDCIRTWFFARDVDADYQGLVEARKENFNRNGLTSNTHYISSTGIQGASANPDVKVMLDSYAIKGLEDGQIRFLKALDYLSPTNVYGVTFERGTQVDFGDRRKVFISGTASIDRSGEILFLNDVEKQLERTFINVNALLEEAECSFDDLMQLIVYLRDVSDYFVVKKRIDECFPALPKVIVHAPVCRPGWLIEVECMAEKQIIQSNFRDL